MVFVSDVVDFSKGSLENVWLMAHFQSKLNKRQIKKTSVSNACEDLQQPNRKLPLRAYGQCLLGLSRIHLKQVEYLHSDCNDAVSKLKITFKKSNVDLPPDKDHVSKHAITLDENANDPNGDSALLPNINLMGGRGNNNNIDNNENDAIFENLPDHRGIGLDLDHIDAVSDNISDYGAGNALGGIGGIGGIGSSAIKLTGSGSHGLGLVATSTGPTNNNNINNAANNLNFIDNNDTHSISSFGGNISNIERLSKSSDMNQFQAKSDAITLASDSNIGRRGRGAVGLNNNNNNINVCDSTSARGIDSPLRRVSFGNGSNLHEPLSYEETQDVDIEIDFNDGNDQTVFDENEAGTPGSVEAGRGAASRMNVNNINNVSNGMMEGELSGLSAIKGPKSHHIDNLSDVASIDNLSQHSETNLNINENDDDIEMGIGIGMGANERNVVMLDESIGIMPAANMIPQMEVEVDVDDDRDTASIGDASVSTAQIAQMEAAREKAKKVKEKRGEKKDGNEDDSESENDTDNEQEGERNEKNKNKNKKLSQREKETEQEKEKEKQKEKELVQDERKRYKRPKKLRFPVETGADGKFETKPNLDKDSYILPERDILHIWRPRPLFETNSKNGDKTDFEEMMEYPVCAAYELFGSGFAANYGNPRSEFERFMPAEVLKCYQDIINARPIENDENENDNEMENESNNNNYNNEMDQMQDESDIEFGRDLNLEDPLNNMEMEMNPLIGTGQRNDIELRGHEKNNNLSDNEHEEQSYLKPKKLNVDRSSTDGEDAVSVSSDITAITGAIGNITYLDCVVNDNVRDLDATVLDEHGTVVSIIPTPENERETRLHGMEEELDNDENEIRNTKKNNKKEKNKEPEAEVDADAEEDEEEDDDVADLREVESKEKEKIKENKNDNGFNIKFRSWSKRTQKTLQYLNNKEGNSFKFNDMMQETTKRETVAGVFYELLVLKNADLIELEQNECFDDITVSKTDAFDDYVGKVKIARMSQSQR